MDENFLSLLGLAITCRTCVTNSNCTPQSQNERCGKPFIFNGVSYHGTSFRVHGGGGLNQLSLPFRLSCRVRTPEKILPGDNSTSRSEYALGSDIHLTGASINSYVY